MVVKRQRRGEMLVLSHIGGSRHTVKALLGLEVLMLVGISAILSSLLSFAVLALIRVYLAG